MMIRTLMVQPAAPTDRQHHLREVMFYLNLSAQEKDAFTERFGVRLLTSYGMTETIVGIIGDRPGDKRRWPSIGRVGFSYEAEIRDDQNRPLPPEKLAKSVLKASPARLSSKSITCSRRQPPGRWNQRAGYIPVIRVTRMRWLFLFCRQTLQHD
ncbi:crotonobetaine/carnitine-CoA ligase [Salmonella enterica subsp. enterica]|uniref:Crotonobetaine/carnitine-CoA ligase n=1 Tax=Salmonella enterica I TaxID=59201 RepID=A0A3S4JAA2_SALET|nr:crotonobetaine/carnitine-CoA ligase [Salmonella enterica subsp. enterica]